MIDIWVPHRDPRKSTKSPKSLFPVGPLTVADLSQVLRFLQIFDKQSLFCTYFPTSSGEVPSGKKLFF